MIQVMIVDDHKLVREGISRLLADVKGIKLVSMAESGEQAVDIVRANPPDVVLMDIKMPGIGGLEATRRILRIAPEVKVVALTGYDTEPFPSRLLGAGAVGYLTKGTDVEEMTLAIRRVMTGRHYISAEIAQQLALRPFSPNQQHPFDQLSDREMQIALMVINGQKVAEISDKLSLSPKTVNSYRYRIFEKLALDNDVMLTKLAIKHGLIDAEAVA